MPTLNFREFTQDDYHGFGGAEDIAPGKPPIICDHLKGLIVVISGREQFQEFGVVVDIMFQEEDIEYNLKIYLFEFPSLEEALMRLFIMFDEKISKHLKAWTITHYLLGVA